MHIPLPVTDNCQNGENDRKNDFMITVHESLMMRPSWDLNLQLLDLQSTDGYGAKLS